MSTPLNTAEYTAALLLAQADRKKKASFKGGETISRGSNHRAAVRGTQERLSELGFEISTDGDFGPETEKALREFQRSRGARVDGILGKETLGKLTRAKRGKSNPADTGIDAIQRVVGTGRPQTSRSGRGLGDAEAIGKGGGTGSRSGGRGRDGRGRSGATKEKKGPNGGSLDSNGKEISSKSTGPIGSTKPVDFGAKSKLGKQDQAPKNSDFEALHPREGGKFAKKGSSGDDVKATQDALNKVGKGKNSLKKDGLFGPKTDAAVRKYQRSAGLTADGIVGPNTLGSLKRRLKLSKRLNGQSSQRPT